MGSSFAENVAAVATAITAATVFLAGIPAVWKLVRKTELVHKIVNQNQTDMKNYQAALIAVLQREGIEIPPDQSLGTLSLAPAEPTSGQHRVE